MVKWVLHVVPNIRPSLCLAIAQGKSIILNAWSQLSNMEVDLWWFGQRISWYSDGPIIYLNGQITANDYVDTVENQVHPMVQILFPNNDAIFQDDISPIHSARSAQSWFDGHEDALQHLPWPAQSPDLNIIKTLWSYLESTVRSSSVLHHP